MDGRLLIVVLLTLACPAALAAVEIPDCAALETWVSPMPVRPPPGYKSGTAADAQAWTATKRRITADILSNESTTATFGSPFRYWTREELDAVRNAMGYCQRDATQARRPDDAMRLYLVMPLVTPYEQQQAGPRSAAGAEAAAPSGGPGHGCAAVDEWVGNVMSQTELVARARAQPHGPDIYAIRAQEKRDLLTDEATLAAFGKPLSRWEQVDYQEYRDRIDHCRLAARQASDGDLGVQLEVGRAAVVDYWSRR